MAAGSGASAGGSPGAGRRRRREWGRAGAASPPHTALSPTPPSLRRCGRWPTPKRVHPTATPSFSMRAGAARLAARALRAADGAAAPDCGA